MEQGWVKTIADFEGQVARIIFHHPQSNSLPGLLLRELAQHIQDAGNNTDYKVIVLQSEGSKVFCAGASFDELAAIQTKVQGLAFFSGFALVINAIRKAPKFVICRVQNKTVGGGVGIACSADYTFATAASSAKLSELAVGIGPFVVGPAVERKIGKAAFQHITINATAWYSAAWAKEKGMYADVFETDEEMDIAITNLIQKLVKSNPEAMAMLKKVFWEDYTNWDTLLFERAEMSGNLVLSDFTKKAIAGFKANTAR